MQIVLSLLCIVGLLRGHESYDAYRHAEICNDLVPQHMVEEHLHIELISNDPAAYLRSIALLHSLFFTFKLANQLLRYWHVIPNLGQDIIQQSEINLSNSSSITIE